MGLELSNYLASAALDAVQFETQFGSQRLTDAPGIPLEGAIIRLMTKSRPTWYLHFRQAH